MLYFKLPNLSTLYTVGHTQSSSPVQFVSFDQKKIAAFKGFIIEADSVDTCKQLNEAVLPHFPKDVQDIVKSDYFALVERTKNILIDRGLKKLVLSRRKPQNISTIKLGDVFFNLQRAYPEAFVYIFTYENTYWLGAFSEILGKYTKKDSTFHTMSLAGTLPLDQEWSDKEYQEQGAVTEYIQNILRDYAIEVNQSPTYTHRSGAIKHLRTDFKIKLEENQLDAIIQELHPTPAVCGHPKALCKDLIHSLENSDREFYAGYSRVETQDEIYFFVTLRCAKIYQDGAVLYVGGGITPLSDPLQEWEETEQKAQALLSHLVRI